MRVNWQVAQEGCVHPQEDRSGPRQGKGGGDEGEVIKHMFGRLSVLMQKDNSMLSLNPTPSVTEPEVDGYI